MKIAYVNYLASISSLPGVAAAIEARYEAVESRGLPIDFFIVTSEAYQDNRFSVMRIDQNLVGMARQKYLVKRRQNISKQYDVIILRKLPYSPWLLYFLRKTKVKIIMEHHTMVLPELWLTQQYLAWISELSLSRWCQRYMSGHIALTNEIARSEVVCQKPTRVIANGLSFNSAYGSDYTRKPSRASINILFALSQSLPWHGIERLIMSLYHYKGQKNITVHFAGNISAKDIDSTYLTRLPRAVSLIFHDLLSTADLSKLAQKCDLGVATLALHKKNMSEACSLKTRFYLNERLPFIYAYDDPDFSHDEIFCLHYPNDDSFIDLDEVVGFVEKMRKNVLTVDKAMGSKSKAIALDEKMQCYYEFASSVF